jgi:uncharacterized protein YcaQ
VLEVHFGRGLLAVADRRVNFARVFDLADRVIPQEHHGRQVHHEEAHRELLRLAARSHGVATAPDLADYYRMPIGQARPRIAELVAARELRQVSVEGWREPAYLHPEAKLPARIDAAALLSPFDPGVWDRARARAMFGFDYRIECYTPAPKRRYGYYVLPILHRGRLVGRLDAKAHRGDGVFELKALYLEPGIEPDERLLAELAQAIQACADWHETPTVRVRKTDPRELAASLRCALAAAR